MTNGAAGIVFNKTRKGVLLVKRRDLPVWVVPGGGIDPDEEPKNASKRETEEETGYKVKVVRQTGVYQKQTNKPTGKTYVFECRVVSGKPRLGKETAAVRYWPLKRLPSQLPFYQKVWVEDAAKNLESVIERKQDINTKKLFLYYLRSPEIILTYLYRQLTRLLK